MEKAIFLDRDGVVNEMVYYPEHGIVDSPFTPGQFRLLPHVAEGIRKFRDMGFIVVVISNQPGMAKGYYSKAVFEEIRETMCTELEKQNTHLDGEYYCLHHPWAKDPSLKVECECRKPKAGLFHQAALNMDIELAGSWMVGDGLTDIEAGKRAGCRTIFIGRMKCELCRLMDESGFRPDFVAVDLLEAAAIVGTENNSLLSSGTSSELKSAN